MADEEKIMDREEEARQFGVFLQQKVFNELPPDMHPYDRELLQRALQLLPVSFEHLCEVIRCSDSAARDQAFISLRVLLVSVFFLGNAGVLSDSGRKIMADIQAFHARQASRSKYDVRRKKLREAIIQTCESSKLELEESRPFAESIQENVRKKLGTSEAERGSSWRTIQREIRTILEERTRT